jgi:hypothetical protein
MHTHFPDANLYPVSPVKSPFLFILTSAGLIASNPSLDGIFEPAENFCTSVGITYVGSSVFGAFRSETKFFSNHELF